MVYLFALQTVESSPYGENLEGDAVNLSQLVLIFPSYFPENDCTKIYRVVLRLDGIGCVSNSSL